jgi:hypothetical protein
MMMMGIPDDMIGAIKIKDGLFIGDEFAAQVSKSRYLKLNVGLRIRDGEQGLTHN